jgi:hypothetical protein
MARAAVIYVACLLLFAAAEACTCPAHSRDYASPTTIGCDCHVDDGYITCGSTFENCVCGFGQVLSDCNQCPSIKTYQWCCRSLLGSHGKNAGSSESETICGCDAGYQITPQSCSLVAGTCTCTQTWAAWAAWELGFASVYNAEDGATSIGLLPGTIILVRSASLLDLWCGR